MITINSASEWRTQVSRARAEKWGQPYRVRLALLQEGASQFGTADLARPRTHLGNAAEMFVANHLYKAVSPFMK